MVALNSDLFNGVESWKETVTTLNTTYLQTTREHRQDISLNFSKINDTRINKIPAIKQDISLNKAAIEDMSVNKIPTIKQDISQNKLDISLKQNQWYK